MLTWGFTIPYKKIGFAKMSGKLDFTAGLTCVGVARRNKIMAIKEIPFLLGKKEKGDSAWILSSRKILQHAGPFRRGCKNPSKVCVPNPCGGTQGLGPRPSSCESHGNIHRGSRILGENNPGDNWQQHKAAWSPKASRTGQARGYAQKACCLVRVYMATTMANSQEFSFEEICSPPNRKLGATWTGQIGNLSWLAISTTVRATTPWGTAVWDDHFYWGLQGHLLILMRSRIQQCDANVIWIPLWFGCQSY